MRIKLATWAMAALCTCPLAAEAQDYASEINSQSKYYGYGRRVIYEMNIGSFTTEGTFNAAEKQLGRLKDLGIDVVWLMPIYPRGTDENSINSPYASKDFSQVNPSYGTVADMRNFVAKAHAMNMEVWLDWVPNHTATDNIWTVTHPDFYRHNADGSFFHPYAGPIKYNDVAQLEYNNPALAEMMTAMQEYWFGATGIDGLRVDFISSTFMPKDYWHKAIPNLKKFKSPLTGKEVTLLGEADFNHSKHLYSAGWDYDYAWAFNDSLQHKKETSDAVRIQRLCEELVSNPNYENLDRMVYLTNHDTNHDNRKPTLKDKYGDNRYPFTVLSFTIYGMPLIYNGQENGNHQDINYFADTKIDWNLTDPKMTNTLRSLTAMKHVVKAFADGKTPAERGSVKFLNTGSKEVLAYLRENDGSKAVVILNLGKAKTIKLNDVQGTWTKWLDSETIVNGLSKSQVQLGKSAKIRLGNKGYIVLVNQK